MLGRVRTPRVNLRLASGVGSPRRDGRYYGWAARHCWHFRTSFSHPHGHPSASNSADKLDVISDPITYPMLVTFSILICFAYTERQALLLRIRAHTVGIQRRCWQRGVDGVRSHLA